MKRLKLNLMSLQRYTWYISLPRTAVSANTAVYNSTYVYDCYVRVFFCGGGDVFRGYMWYLVWGGGMCCVDVFAVIVGWVSLCWGVCRV